MYCNPTANFDCFFFYRTCKGAFKGTCKVILKMLISAVL